MTNPRVSVIIPTYNRPAVLRRLLQALSRQTYPFDCWEVFVVDDGSTDPGYEQVYAAPSPYRQTFIQQDHAGAAAARNLGAQRSQADFLVFLDDDVTVEPDFLAHMVRDHQRYDRVVLMGNFKTYVDEKMSTFRSAVVHSGVTQDSPLDVGDEGGEISFIHCVSHNISMKRPHFMEIGMFQDPTNGKGWPNWDDLDLAYRAYKAGFTFRVVVDAAGSHVDGVLDDFRLYCQRVWRAGRYAHYLFAKFPELREQLPMFQDKNPINLHNDSAMLALRKTFRALTAWRPLLRLMEGMVAVLERRCPNTKLLVRLYRWINSSYIYRGYRMGLFLPE